MLGPKDYRRDSDRVWAKGRTTMKPLLSIQYLRALAALAVVAYHAMQWRDEGFDVGRAGVDVFFVISGVIMWGITAGREVSPLGFVWRRLTRVAPLYWVATLLVAGIAAVWPWFLPQVSADPRHLALSLAFIPHFDPLGRPFPTLPPGWSLIYEAIFYLIFTLALAGPRAWRGRVAVGGLTAVVASGILLNDPVYILGANPMLWQFAAGLGLGVALEHQALPSRPWGMALIAAALAVWAIIQSSGIFVELWRPFFWGAPATLLVAGALSLEANGGVREWGWLRRLGDASYAIYLFHLPAVAIVAHTAGFRHPWVFIPLAILAAVGAGLAAHYWIEKPLLTLARRAAVTATSPPAA